MATPVIEVLGVYRLDVAAELVREQCAILYPDAMSPKERGEAEQQCREQLKSVVLVEVIVRDRDDRFAVGDFAQAGVGVSREDWQAAWAEAYLVEDGESLSVERWSDSPADNPLRVAFFIHSWDPAQPLQSSYGEVRCPPPEKMPVRLQRIVPYELLD